MVREDYKRLLKDYLPEQALDQAVNWLIHYKFDLKITKGRLTKFGDYRAPFQGSNHLITINQNLNKYNFLITLTHEVAHLVNWNKNQNRVKPHGQEWKNEFKLLLNPFIAQGIFPSAIESALTEHMDSPTASCCTDPNLLRAIKGEEPANGSIMLEDLPINTIFKTLNNRYFIKGEKNKKRIRCTELKSRVVYLFNPLAEVYTIKKDLF